MYILKQISEDFVVDEVPQREFSVEKISKNKYVIYNLRKKNYNTEDAVQEISRALNIQRKSIGYAGAKDRNALTTQYISILGGGRELLQKDLALTFVGYSDEPISLGSLKGNSFQITIRNLENEDVVNIKKNCSLKKFVNYFDAQRFSKNNDEIGKLIITKNYKAAAELIQRDDSRISGDIKDYLTQRPNAYLNALKLVVRKTLMIYMHAYQSKLWNRAVEEMISEKKEIEKMPLLGFGTELEGEIKIIYEKILAEENITLRDFILRDFPEISLEGDSRRVFVEMENLQISEVEDDELNEGKKKVVVEFFLDKGAYATMAVKNLVEGK